MAIAGSRVGERLCEALGLQGHSVAKLVLVVDLKEAVTLYVKEFPPAERLEAAIGVLEGMKEIPVDSPESLREVDAVCERLNVIHVEAVEVGDDGNVTHVPRDV